MIYHTDPQGSDEWLAARRGVITGSRFKDARDRSDGLDEKQRVYVNAILAGKPEAEARAEAGYKAAPTSTLVAQAIAGKLIKQWSAKALAYARDLARERCGGRAPEAYQTKAMREGHEQEPLARAAYEAVTGNLVDEVEFIADDDRMFGCSPDGLIDADGVLEIKTMVASETLFTAVGHGDISEYIDQCNGYLWLMGRKWVDLVLWAPDLEDLGLHITVRRIRRDEAAIEALEADLLAFAALVRENEALLRTAAEKLNPKKDIEPMENIPEIAKSAPVVAEAAAPLFVLPAPEILLLPDMARDITSLPVAA